VETHRTGKLIPVDATVSTPVTPSDAASD
jgi:hypothetical protein